MTSTFSNNDTKQPVIPSESESEMLPEEIEQMNNLRRKALARKISVARKQASRIQSMPDGRRVFIRFSPAQRIEHQLLLISFTALALTGLFQRYSHLAIVGFVMNLFGGIDTSRLIHHLAAVIFGLLAIYHFYQILYTWFVNRELGGMWPRFKDLKDLFKTMAYNLGLSKEKPLHDRFSIEEKVEYWALLWGTVLMGITGLVQWFPTAFTSVFPGIIIPVSRIAHSWEAVLAVLSIVIWHGYHSLVKEKNRSIFTGYMTETEMHESHPLELRRILNAEKFLKKLNGKGIQGSTSVSPEDPNIETLHQEKVLENEQ